MDEALPHWPDGRFYLQLIPVIAHFVRCFTLSHIFPLIQRTSTFNTQCVTATVQACEEIIIKRKKNLIFF